MASTTPLYQEPVSSELPDPTPDPDALRELQPRTTRPVRAPRTVGLLELLTFAGLLTAVVIFRADELTVGAVLIVGVVWLVYTVAARRARRPTKDLQAELDRIARRRLVTLDGPRLPARGPAEILAEVAEDPRWQPPGWLSTGQGVLVSLGLVGTFAGLSIGLYFSVDDIGAADPAVMQQGMKSLLDGAKLAFVKSLAGVFCGMVWSLRYRWLEIVHESWLDDQRKWLAARYPVVTELELALRAEGQRRADHRALSEALGQWADRSDRRAEALLDTLARAVSAQSEATTGAGRDRAALLEKVTAGVDQVTELRDLIDSLSKTLPENIGDQTAGLLKPSLDQMVTALAELSSAGGQAIGSTLQDSMGAEVNGLRQSLAQISQLLEGLGPRVEQQVQQGAANAASALSDAGRQTSDQLRSAASELTGGVAELQSMADAIRAALGETHQVADALRGAGDEVATGLRGVADPLVQLPTTLEGARAAIFAAQDGMARTNVASVAHAERLAQLVELTDVSPRATPYASAHAAGDWGA